MQDRGGHHIGQQFCHIGIGGFGMDKIDFLAVCPGFAGGQFRFRHFFGGSRRTCGNDQCQHGQQDEGRLFHVKFFSFSLSFIFIIPNGMFDLTCHEGLRGFQKSVQAGLRAKVDGLAVKFGARIPRGIFDVAATGGFVTGRFVEGEHLVIGDW